MTTNDMDRASLMLAGAVNQIMQETDLTASAMFYVAKGVLGQLAEIRTEEILLSIQPTEPTEPPKEPPKPPQSVSMSDIKEALKEKREKGLVDSDGKAHVGLAEVARRKAEK